MNAMFGSGIEDISTHRQSRVHTIKPRARRTYGIETVAINNAAKQHQLHRRGLGELYLGGWTPISPPVHREAKDSLKVGMTEMLHRGRPKSSIKWVLSARQLPLPFPPSSIPSTEKWHLAFEMRNLCPDSTDPMPTPRILSVNFTPIIPLCNHTTK